MTLSSVTSPGLFPCLSMLCTNKHKQHPEGYEKKFSHEAYFTYKPQSHHENCLTLLLISLCSLRRCVYIRKLGSFLKYFLKSMVFSRQIQITSNICKKAGASGNQFPSCAAQCIH